MTTLYPLRGQSLTRGACCLFDESNHREAYADHFERLFDAIQPPFYAGSGKVRPATARTRGRVRHYLNKDTRPSDSFEVFDATEASGHKGWGTEFESIVPYFRGNLEDPLEAKPVHSSHRFFLATKRPASETLSWLLDLAQHVPIRYAVGGWLLLGRDPRDVAYGFCRRHPGAIFWDSCVGDAKHGIRDTNWLTLVTNGILKKAGGIAAARKQLSSEITIHEALDGCLFQAGPEPLLGDRENPVDDFRLYGEVARFLKPCRDKVALWGPYEAPFAGSSGYFTHEETLRWIARFDEGNPYTLKEPLRVEPEKSMGQRAFEDEEAFATVLRDVKAHGDEAAIVHGIHPISFRTLKKQFFAELKKDPARAKAFKELMKQVEARPPLVFKSYGAR